MSLRLQHIMGAKLTFENGESVMLERLGKGMFHKVFVDRAKSQVYAITIDRDDIQDYSKEILSHPQLGCQGTGNVHIPVVEYVGDIQEQRVYRMPLYHPLKATNKGAWSLLKMLIALRENAWQKIYSEQVYTNKMRATDIGAMVNDAVCNDVSSPESLAEALGEMRDSASNYGASYCFEFNRKNVMVDDNGNLILLDVLFNLEAVKQIQVARSKKATNY